MARMSILCIAFLLLLSISRLPSTFGRATSRQLGYYHSPSTPSYTPPDSPVSSPSGSSPTPSTPSYTPAPSSAGYSPPSSGSSPSGGSTPNPSTPSYSTPSSRSSPSGSYKLHYVHKSHHGNHHHHHKNRHHSSTIPSYGSPPSSGSSPVEIPPTPTESPPTYTPPPSVLPPAVTPPYGSGSPSSGSSPLVGSPISSPVIGSPISSPIIGSPVSSPVIGTPIVGGTSPPHYGGGSCDYWKSHVAKFPNVLSGLGTLLKLFGSRAGSIYGSSMTVIQALESSKQDGYSELAKQGTASLFNAYTVAGFSYTPHQVRQAFNAALDNPDLARLQASLFEQANLSV